MKQPSKARKRFAVWVENEGYRASLERWKIYQVIPDRDAERHHPANLRRLYRVEAVA